MSDISNLRDTIIPKSDQLNAEQLLGREITVTITGVARGASEEQPVTLHYAGDEGRPYKPCKSMRKVLIFAWGDDGHEWVGKSMTLYNDPDVKFGGVKVGGIRIRSLSHIERDLALSLTATRGKKENYVIKRMDGNGGGWFADHIKIINEAGTLADLKTAYDAATAACRKMNDGAAREKVVAAKDARKLQIESAAKAGADVDTGEVV